jgi:hypothetical protein
MEASVVGSVSQSGTLLSFANAVDSTAATCQQIAYDFWDKTPHDAQNALTGELGYVNQLANGIGMQLLAANLTQRALGNLGARNQAALM